MSKSEVEKIFNIRCKEFGVNTFRRDYLKRQSGDPKNAIDENSSQKFFLRKEFFVGIDEDQMNAIDSRITNYYVNKFSINKDFTNLLERLLEENNSDKMFQFIESLLRDDQRDENRKGQNFEITSFAILKQFYLMRGFSLNRFSTTFANDGGMDFIGENAIYQATVVMSPKKFQEDIIKTPKIKRVIVYKSLVKNFDTSLFDDDLILDVIDLEKLYAHLCYIKDAVNKNFLRDIIQVIIDEFNREFYY